MSFNLFSHGDSGAGIAKEGRADQTLQAKVIIDGIDDGVILIDSQFTIQLINPSASKLCGWKTDEATGINVDSVVQLVNSKNERLDNNQNPLHQIFSTGQTVTNNDLTLLTRDNQSVPIRLHITPLVNENKQVYQAVAVLNNVSEERNNEKQRADFISTASHEMRTPVAAIEGYLALALNDKVSTIDSRARGYLEKAHASTQHLGQLFQDLLTSAKAEDGRLTSHPTVVEMNDFLGQLISDLRLVAAKKNLAVDFVYGDNTSSTVINATKEGSQKVITPLYYAYVDPDRLREVITNLFDNAVKYTPEGKITMGLTGNEQVVQCFIKDTGAGIPKEDLPHLFQKFYRVDNSATRTIGGTGLGLFICRKIVELYNGRIWVESELGKGSTFYINFPRLSTDKASQLQSQATTPAVAGG
ncbi:MAG TPA: ATP-binding protein [Candidatus Saccharimonadales bacterium]|nr:ATP-binding protein [Candidatus Saccharimonadales bacterium]